MTWDSVPWFVGGGAQHSPEVARLLAYSTAGGAEGIVDPGDLKVSALPTPGSKVIVGPGAIRINSRASGGSQQTYIGRNASDDQVSVAAQGSGSTRYDLVVARIEDPFMAGEQWQNPADAKVGPYIFSRVVSNVGAATIGSYWSAKKYLTNLGYSAEPLAGITMPPNTPTVNNSMIKDLRKLASPQRDRELFRFQPGDDASAGQKIDDPNGLYQWWPAWEPTFVVPTWATHVVAVMNVTGILKPIGGDIIGDLRLEWCNPGVPGASIGGTVFEESANDDWRRVAITVSGETSVIADRGLTKSFRVGARRHLANSAAGATLQTMGGTNFILDVEFQQRAV